MDDLLTAKELAERLRVRPETVKAWTREGLIPRVRITPKVIRYDLEQVMRAIQKSSDAPETEREGRGGT